MNVSVSTFVHIYIHFPFLNLPYVLCLYLCAILYCTVLHMHIQYKQQHFSLHTQASLKKFMDYIQTSAVDKMVKFIDKGLDPNYQDSDTGGKESHRA